MLTDLIATHGWLTCAGLAIAILAISTLHGATGLAGGFLLGALLAPFVGVRAVVPVMSIVLLISHSSRALLNLRDLDRTGFLLIFAPAIPGIVFIAGLYKQIPTYLLALVLGATILLAVPLRRWCERHEFTIGNAALAAAGLAFGPLTAVSLGPGVLLAPIMLAYGMAKEQFVATLAAFAAGTNVLRIIMFGGAALIGPETLALGLAVGALTIPGNWLGRTFLRQMSNRRFTLIADALVLLGAIYFLWTAFRAWITV
ncbi:MAG: sulfite exporter TauE/SafE family protein [Pseudomonadota bacterium]